MADNGVEWRQTTTCKHPPGTLYVYRNEGIRWVECSDCHTVFENRAYSEALESRIKELEAGIRDVVWAPEHNGFRDAIVRLRYLIPEGGK